MAPGRSIAGGSASAVTLLTGPAGLPRALDAEILRLRLVRLLEGRWDRPVTLLIAGPGFGKTTVLAQAVRAHQVAPRGIDVWVSCEAAYEDPICFATALLDAMSVGDRARGPGALAAPGPREVVEALIRRAPLEVCLLLDDVHEIPPGSPGAALLSEVTRKLPATAHLVLSGREAPDVPLARREAAGEVIRIGGENLAFTHVEVRALARRLGQDARIAEPLHGWPAMVRLSLAAGAAAPWQYAREEVLARVSESQRQALAALAALGTGTASEVGEVTGGPVTLDDLARQIPLVAVLGDGRYRAHDLWADALPRIMTVQDGHALWERAATVLAARGDLARAGRLACQVGDWRLLGDLAVDLVHKTLSALPRTLAKSWLRAVPPPIGDDPAFVLLRAAVLHAGDFMDPRIDPLLDRSWQGMLDRGDQRGAAAVLGQAMITAHSRADLDRLAVVADWGEQFDGPVSPVVTLLRRNIAAMRAEAAGDPEAALAEFAQAPIHEVPRALALSLWRFHFHCLNMCGRGQEAAELADRTLADAGDELVRLSGPMARWFDGDPSGLNRLRRQGLGAVIAHAAASSGAGAQAEGRRPARVTDTTTAREGFVATALAAVMAASCGEEAPFGPLPCGDPAGYDNPRDAVLACAAQASVAVARGAEGAARLAYAGHVARWPVEDRFAERHLRRFLALGYVLSDRLRAHWDGVALGPSHLAARAAARALVRARAGDLTAAGELAPAYALCFLPLSWSVELAARLAAAGHPHGHELGRWLADTLGPTVHRQLRETARSDWPLAAGAAELLAALPAPPAHRTQIEVIGPMRLARDGVPVDAPEFRRARVRQLLGVLVVRPVLTRDQAIALLWPELDPVKAARNMRVTLTHLRRLLEPGRSGGEASYHLRTDGDMIRLLPSQFLSVDLWTLDALDKEAGQARADGDIDRTAALLTEAVALWGGDPLPDLVHVRSTDVLGEVDQVRIRHVSRLLALSELRLVADDAAGSFELAERALSLEPFDARGHCLALAAALRGRSTAQITAAHRRVRSALRQLGVPPDPPTEILLRQAARLAGGRAT